MSFVYERHYRGPIRGVVVDWAGTIVDYGCRGPVEAFRTAFAREGVEITVAEAREPMGLAKRDHIRAILRMPRVADAFKAKLSRVPGDADLDRLYERFLPLQLSVLGDHARVIDGAIDAFAAFRARGIRIGSSTGYVKELMDVLVPLVERQGLHVDSMLCASDVPEGRPAPFMCYANATRLGVYPMAAMVKIGDTVADVEEGLNAGMWTIGVSRTGNEVGLSEEEQRALSDGELAARVAAAAERLRRAGAHFVVESIADCPQVVETISRQLERGQL
jgi:phosphonoacetaldehyde hydrolase